MPFGTSIWQWVGFYFYLNITANQPAKTYPGFDASNQSVILPPRGRSKSWGSSVVVAGFPFTPLGYSLLHPLVIQPGRKDQKGGNSTARFDHQRFSNFSTVLSGTAVQCPPALHLVLIPQLRLRALQGVHFRIITLP